MRRAGRYADRLRVLAASAAALCAASATAHAATATVKEPTGVWNRDDGLGGVRIAACGDALCGHVAWLRDAGGPAYIGQKVLFGMHRTAGNAWSGTAHNPEDGRDYSGSMRVDGDRLLTRGCLFGGFFCKEVALTRAR